MTAFLLAEFADPERFVEAAQARAAAADYRLVDAFSPFPVEGMDELLEHRRSRIRLVMFIGGVAMAALAYGLEYYRRSINYPYNSGGRPLDSWPAFMLVPFAIGILAAAIAGFTAFLIETGLPRLHHPLFAVDGFRTRQPRPLRPGARTAGADDEFGARDRFPARGRRHAIREVEP